MGHAWPLPTRRPQPVFGIEDTCVTHCYDGFGYCMHYGQATAKEFFDAENRQLLVTPEYDTVVLGFGKILA